MPLIPQVVHTLKSLSSVALLAVSQLCTTRSKSLRPFVLAIALEPFRLDQAATQGRRGLLILASEIVFPDRPADAVESVERLARGVQRLTLPAAKPSRSPERANANNSHPSAHACTNVQHKADPRVDPNAERGTSGDHLKSASTIVYALWSTKTTAGPLITCSSVPSLRTLDDIGEISILRFDLVIGSNRPPQPYPLRSLPRNTQ